MGTCIVILFTQGLRIVLELDQHSTAQKLSREIQQIGVVEEYDEFLEFSGHDDGKTELNTTHSHHYRPATVTCHSPPYRTYDNNGKQ